MSENFELEENSFSILAPDATEIERAAEAALRPKTLDEFIGQPAVRRQLGVILDAARGRGEAVDHVLLVGPPGLGKTTLAMIVASEMGASLRITSGPAVQHAGDLASILSALQPGDVLFIDEIHRLARTAEEMLYLAMEDYRVDIIVGKGPGATSIPLTLPRFTVVGATTRSGLLPAPLRDRFGFTAHLEFYSSEDLAKVVRRSSKLMGVKALDEAAVEIAGRSRGTPRIANRLLRRVADYSQVQGHSTVTLNYAQDALELFEVDTLGLDRLDRILLETICQNFGGGPVGLGTLAHTIGDEAETLETVAEPYLVRQGFLTRTPRGRIATQKAWEHLGLAAPNTDGLFST